MEVVQQDKKQRFIEKFQPDFTFDHSETQKAYRDAALNAFEQLEFPTTRTEYWKYTRIAKLLKTAFSPVVKPAELSKVPAMPIPELDAYKMVFVNGEFQPAVSNKTDEGFLLLPLSEAKVKHAGLVDEYLGRLTDQENHIFSALNGYYHHDGLFLHVPKNKVLDKPVHLINIAEGERNVFQPRNLAVLKTGASANVLVNEVSNGDTQVFSNSIWETFVGENAHFKSAEITDAGEKDYFVQTSDAQLDKYATYSNWNFYLGGGLVRKNLNAKLIDEHCEANLNGLYLPNHKEHVDFHTFIDHVAPNCQSNELYRGIVSDKATGVFNGKVLVRPDAQKTDAFQENNNILMSDGATVNSKPELEIYADDVKCSHGSTTGQLDEEALFYLMSRGIPRQSALQILVKAFANDVVKSYPVEAVQVFLDQKIDGHFN